MEETFFKDTTSFETNNNSRSPTKNKDYYIHLKQGTEEWLNARNDFDLNGSELGAALGVGRFRTRRQLYQIKRRRFSEPTFGEVSNDLEEPGADEIAFEYGRTHEPDAVKEFEQHFLPKLVNGFDSFMEETGIWPIDCGSFTIGVSPDRLLMIKRKGFSDCVSATYEAKCPLSGKPMNPPHPEYVVQVHSQMQAVGTVYGYLHCWTPARGSLLYRVARDDGLWALLTCGWEDFVMEHLRKELPPEEQDDSTWNPKDEMDDARAELLRHLGRTVTLVCCRNPE